MVRNRRDAVTPLKGVTENAAGGPGTGYRDEIIAIIVVQKLPQCALGYTGLNSDNAHFGIEIGNTVKPTQIQDDATFFNRVGATITPVMACAHRVDGDLVERLAELLPPDPGSLGGVRRELSVSFL